MLDQNPDGSHSIMLHDINCPGKPPVPHSSGMLTWSRENGIAFSLTFTGTSSLVGTKFHDEPPQQSRGIGRFVENVLTQPRWVGKTDDGTAVRLYGVNEVPFSRQTTGTSDFSTSCGFEGTALFAVVEIPVSRLLAFDNSTEEDFRMFFVGSAGKRHRVQQDVTFHGQDGVSTTTCRCSTPLSDSPRVSLVSTHSLVECQPSGLLSFDQEPFTSECEIGAFAEQNFVSFLNGRRTPFFWADRRQPSGVIRRTYFGWMKSGHQDYERCHNQPLPLLDGIEVFQYGETVRDLLPAFFSQFIQRSHEIDFTINRATIKTGRTFVADAYTAFVMHLLASETSIPRPESAENVKVFFPKFFLETFEKKRLEGFFSLMSPARIGVEEISSNPSRYVMLFRPSMLESDFGGTLPPGTRCLYSRWTGYLDRPDWQPVKDALTKAEGDLIEVHTSGHIFHGDIIDLVGQLSAKLVVPIHTFEPEKFQAFLSTVKLLADGETMSL